MWFSKVVEFDVAIGSKADATTQRQPTPKSIGDAVARLGLASPENVKAIKEAMTRALEADRNGDRSGCEKALADARRVLRQ